jgi:hypothetical protein
VRFDRRRTERLEYNSFFFSIEEARRGGRTNACWAGVLWCEMAEERVSENMYQTVHFFFWGGGWSAGEPDTINFLALVFLKVRYNAKK